MLTEMSGRAGTAEDGFSYASAAYSKELEALKTQADKAAAELHSLFAFSEAAFTDGNELTILLTRLTADTAPSRFIASFGSEDYRRLSKELMVSERSAAIREEILRLDL